MDLSKYYQNVRGLRTKIEMVKLNASTLDHDIIALTETWLSSDISDVELFPVGYNVFRIDRNHRSLNCTRDDGCLLAAKSSLLATRMPELECESDLIDVIWVRIACHGGGAFYVCLVYIPPSTTSMSSQSLVNSHSEFLYSLCMAYVRLGSDAIITIIGGFNCPKVNWVGDLHFSSLRPINSSGSWATQLVGSCETVSLVQYNGIPNCAGNVLDLVLCNSTARGSKLNQR